MPGLAGSPTGAATFEDVGSQVVLKAATTYPAPIEIVEEPPVSLTAGDGTGLRLVDYTARSSVQGPLAFTELRLTFSNPQDRVLEGRFQLALPEGAAISRLAMKIDGGWQEAEVVELTQARRVYEDFLHQAQDPALLENEAGNLFRARIFPIPARGKKELIVSFSQELRSPSDDFQLPLRGLPQVDQLDIAAVVIDAAGGRKTTRLSRRGWVPDTNFRAPRVGAARALRSGAMFAAYVDPPGTNQRAPLAAMTFAFDTSASRAPGFARSVDQLAGVIGGLAKSGDPEVAVIAFDQETTPIYAGKASGFGPAAVRRLLARRPLGASDLGAALRTAAAIGHKRVVVFGDAVATAGTREPAQLVAIARELKLDRIDVIIRGGIRDRDAAEALATAAGGAVLDGDRASAAELARHLGERVANGVTLSAPGAKWIWPSRLDGVLAGESRIVYGVLESAQTPLSLSAGGAAMSTRASAAPETLLSRATARAEIARLEAQLAAMGADAGKRRELIKQRIIATSTSHRVLSRFTGLLVLETEEDYRRFNIQRTALADILTVNERGDVVGLSRNDLVIPDKPAVPERDVTKSDDNDGKLKKKEQAPGDAAKTTAEPTAQQPSVDMPEPKPAPAAEPPPPPRTERAERVADRRRPEPAATTASESVDFDGDAVAGAAADDDDDDESEESAEVETGPPPITGTFATVRGLIDAKRHDDALVAALAWQRESAGDVMALVALGEALEAAGHQRLAARAYGSIIDLFPSRADLRRYAGMRLARLDAGVKLAADSFAAAVASRPDHLTGHRLLAYARARDGRYAEAMKALEDGLTQRYPDGRFAGGLRVLAEDLAIVGAAWIAADPSMRAEVTRRLAARDLAPAKPSVRFVLSWETDANDVDFHIHDAKGGHASYRNKSLPSGGELFADITNGYGPECFAIPGKPTAGPYRIRAHYYSRGPMGYGIGQLEIVQWNGKSLSIEARPFVVMNDGAYLELGSWPAK